MNTVTVRGITLGAGKPKIAVSIIGSTTEEILTQTQALQSLPVDIAEWRMDWFSQAEDHLAVFQCLSSLREVLGNTPLLATFRTKQEGGQCAIDIQNYAALNHFVLSSGLIDLLDVELFAGESIVRQLIDDAHIHKIPVVLSSHDFEKTPPKEEMVSRLCRMQELGGDLLKLAVMPQSRADVITLLQATDQMYSQYATQPLITMSMGQLGMLTRMCGEFSGSAMTFGAATQSSAPGQIPVEKLNQLLELFSSASN